MLRITTQQTAGQRATITARLVSMTPTQRCNISIDLIALLRDVARCDDAMTVRNAAHALDLIDALGLEF
jgi:hypothetical protein